MIPALVLLFILCCTSVRGNTEGDYCEVLEEYDKFKMSLDNFLASRDEPCKNKRIRSDCASIKEEFPEATDGVYRIKPRDGKPTFLAFCDMTAQGGGWLVIQRRQDGSEDFDRTWFEYMDGFGNLTGEFWLGNEKIHRLTSQKQYTLRIDFRDAKRKTAYVEYTHFRVANMSEFYNLTVSGFSGRGAGDKLAYHNNSRFTARNLDLDSHGNLNCANCKYRNGGWWYKDCGYTSLNGLYTSTGSTGIWWNGLSNSKETTMKIRPSY